MCGEGEKASERESLIKIILFLLLSNNLCGKFTKILLCCFTKAKKSFIFYYHVNEYK